MVTNQRRPSTISYNASGIHFFSLVFSSFVSVLDVVEFFMEQIHNKTGNDLGTENHFHYNEVHTTKTFSCFPINSSGVDDFHGPWQKDYNYFRLDGKTSKTLRHDMIKRFNNPANTQVKCFLISAKAGGQGINLVGANRVILLDTSWNPSSDQQNIFRVFRLGQKRKCYIYRLLAMVIGQIFFDFILWIVFRVGNHGGKSLFQVGDQASDEFSRSR